MFALPQPLHFGMSFPPSGIFAMGRAYIVTMVETTDTFMAPGPATETKMRGTLLKRGVLCDGVGSAFASTIYPNDCRLDDSIEAAHTIGMRQAMLLQRVGCGPDARRWRAGRWNWRHWAARRSWAAALVFCTPANVNHSVINGKVVVKDGVLRMVDLPVVLERHNRLAAQLALAAEVWKP